MRLWSRSSSRAKSCRSWHSPTASASSFCRRHRITSAWATATPAPTRAAVTTVLAARGSPEKPERGAAIGIPQDLGSNVLVFHAGTALDAGGTLTTAGGRVLNVTGLGADVPAAARVSAAACERIAFDGKTWRRDIAWRELQRAGAA